MKTIVNYSTKQKGYGRQALYVDIQFNNLLFKNVYVEDIFPNLEEGKGYILEVDAFYDEDREIYHDGNGKYYDEDVVFKTTLDAVKSFVNIDDLEIEAYAIAFNYEPSIEYLNDNLSNSTSRLIENAYLFKTEEEALEHFKEEDEKRYIECVC